MKLQIALDTTNIPESLELLEEINAYVDIIEVGTPFIIREGIRPVAIFKKRFPDKEILADVKIMDAGYFEAGICFEAGADIVTVLGAAHDETLLGAIKAAKEFKGKVMVDIIAVKDLAARAKEIEALGADYICVHTAFDIQDEKNNPLVELETLNKVIAKDKIAVAGGLKLDNMKEVVALGATVIVVGGGIINQTNRKQAAKAIKEVMNYE